MGIKKYLSLDKLDLFYEKLKAKMSSDNTSTLNSAKAYTDAELLEFAGEMNEAIDLLDTAIEGKADSVHTHTIAQVDGLQAELNSKEAKGSAEAALSEAKSYIDTEVVSTLESANSHTNTKIAELINGAPTTLDTLGEIATAFAENKDVVEALNEAIGSKANVTHSHAIGDVTNLQTTLDGLATKTDVTLAKGTVPATFGYDVVMDFMLNSSVEKFDYIASVSGGNYYFFRITDKVITKTELEQLKTKGSNMSFSVYGYGDFAFPITEIAVVDESEKIITFSEFAVCVTEDNVTSGTTVFPKAGIYSIGITGAMLVNSIAIDGLDLSMSETSKYFKKTEATVTNVIEWDGDTTGLVAIADTFYKVSDAIPLSSDPADFVGSVATASNNLSLSFSIDDIIAGDGYIGLSFVAILITKENTTMEGVTFQETGVYFGKFNDGGDIFYISKFEAPTPIFGIGDTVEKLDEKYLPDTVATKDDIEPLNNAFDIEEVYTYVFTGEEETASGAFAYMENVTEDTILSLSSLYTDLGSGKDVVEFGENDIIVAMEQDGATVYGSQTFPTLMFVAVYSDGFTLNAETPVTFPKSGIWVYGTCVAGDTLTFNTPYTVSKLKPSYLPEGYPYVKPPEEVVYIDDTLEGFSDAYGMGIGIYEAETTLSPFVEGEYTVTWDGTEYVCTAFYADGVYALGNGYLMGFADTGEPFFMGIASGVISIFALTDVTSTSHTVSIVGTIAEVVKMDEKYLPKSVGKDVAGQEFTLEDDTVVTAGVGAEIFNDYSYNIASGWYAHAEGNDTTASGNYSHAEGNNTTASGNYSHAEGFDTTASGDNSHAEGFYTTASGWSSHAEGSDTTASGCSSHAEGNFTVASGDYSHAEGNHTKASSDYQHVQGKYNIEDAGDKYAHIVGNGKSDTERSNAHTLDWSGNAWFAGTIKVGGTGQDDTTAKSVMTTDYITTGTEELEVGVSALENGHIHLVLEE